MARRNYFITEKFKTGNKIKQIDNKKLGLVDLAMLLIVLQQLFEVTHRKFIIKNDYRAENQINHIYEINGNLSEIRSFAGAILNIIGQFITIASKFTWEEQNDEYAIKKLNHYKNINHVSINIYRNFNRL